MQNKKIKKSVGAAKNTTEEHGHPRPKWVPETMLGEEMLCPDCFKVVGERSRYNMVCLLGRTKNGMSVSEITDRMNLRQPTITHHLQILGSVNAVKVRSQGRERIYSLNRDAHCFEDCKIPY